MFNNKTVYRSQQRFKSYNHDVYIEEVNKIPLNSNDDKRLQTFDRIVTYPYGTNVSMWKWNANGKNLFFEKLKWNIKMMKFDKYVNEN